MKGERWIHHDDERKVPAVITGLFTYKRANHTAEMTSSPAAAAIRGDSFQSRFNHITIRRGEERRVTG